MNFSKFLAISFIVGLISSCGGGSAGTGTGTEKRQIIEGVVQLESQQPVDGVLVTILETGDNDITDATGKFSIEASETLSANPTIELSKGNNRSTRTISAQSENGVISLTFVVNPLLEEITSESLQVDTKIVGACDIYFENSADGGKKIRQANAVDGTVGCTARVKIRNNNETLAHIPVAIQYRRCKFGSPWHPLALGETMTGANRGTALIEFPFVDDETHCVYQIIAPYKEKVFVETLLETFTFQSQQ